MACKKCGSNREVDVLGERVQLIDVYTGRTDSEGGTERSGLGSGDELRFRYCLQCGVIAGSWPRGDLSP